MEMSGDMGIENLANQEEDDDEYEEEEKIPGCNPYDYMEKSGKNSYLTLKLPEQSIDMTDISIN